MEGINKLAPIVLFCYNRPWHTQQTLDALSLNQLASASDLIVYCDGPKNDSDDKTLLSINETRNVIQSEKRFNSITIVESDYNKGLATSIIEGVTEVVNRFGKIIVLEDDIVTSPGFLRYMNDALEVYQNDEKVMHISGYMFPIKNNLPETFFIRPTTCWGWGTWSRAWKHFEKDIDKQIAKISNAKLWNKFTLNGSYPSYKAQLYLNQKGEINTWAIFWYVSVFLKKGTCLHPYPSLVQNIGLDGSGVHCNSIEANKSPYFWVKLADTIEVKKKTKKTTYFQHKILINYFRTISEVKNDLTFRDRFYLFRKRLFK